MLKYELIKSGKSGVVESGQFDLYQYTAYIGENRVKTYPKASYWYIDNGTVVSKTGNGEIIDSEVLCVEIFGYTPETRTSSYNRLTDLPYINGCSSKQLISPNRLGDPTWQMLHIPPYTSEQAHHIHSTARIVYVLSGKGKSHIGQGSKVKSFDLKPGDVLVLDKMIPHHFSTAEEGLVVLPLHIFSSIDQEFNHPMFNGTHRT
jgi:mannose-6-phosphate isomerase-like protein (cupin superfamily)